MSTWNGTYLDTYWGLVVKQIFCLILQNFARQHFLNLRIFMIKSSSAILIFATNAQYRDYEKDSSEKLWGLSLKCCIRPADGVVFHRENSATCWWNVPLIKLQLMKNLDSQISKSMMRAAYRIVSRCHRLNCTRNTKKRHNNLKLWGALEKFWYTL